MALIFIFVVGWRLKITSTRKQQPIKRDEESGPTETSVMMHRGCEGDANPSLKEPVCVIGRTTPGIIFTDDTYTWTSLGQLVTDSFILDDVTSGFSYIRDVIPVPTQDGGLIVIDSTGMHQFTSGYHYKFVHLYKQLPGGYLCVTHFSRNKLLFGLVIGKLVIFDLNKTEVSTFSSILPVGDREVKLADISVDCQGFVFAGDSKGKAISMFDSDGVYIKRVEIDVEPNFLFAHTTTEIKVDLFVSSETTVEIYGVDRKSCYPYRSMLGAATCIIDEKKAEKDSFRSGGVVVRGNKLFLVNKLHDDKNVQVLQRDVVSGDEEHSFIVEVSEEEADSVTSRGIKGIAFVDGDEILVYFDNDAYIFKKTKRIMPHE